MGRNLVLRRLYVLFRNSTMLWAAFCCIDLYQGCDEGDTIPLALNRCGRRMTTGGFKMSQQCHKYFLQYSIFASEKL